MKNLFVLICLFFLCMNVFAGGKLESGSLAPLCSVKKVNYEIVFTYIHGLSEKAFSEYETDWYKDKPEIVGEIFYDIKNKLKDNFELGEFPDAEYTIRVVVEDISRKGDFDCSVEVVNKNGSVIAKITDIHSEGGRWGSKLNLIKDGAESIGKHIGSALKTEIKRAGK